MVENLNFHQRCIGGVVRNKREYLWRKTLVVLVLKTLIDLKYISLFQVDELPVELVIWGGTC